MKRVTEIQTLPIVEMKGGTEVGKVYDVMVDFKSRDIFIAFVSKKPMKIAFLEAAKIQGIGKDFVLIKDVDVLNAEVEEKDFTYYSLMGIEVVNSQGNSIGHVKEFTLEDGARGISQIILENGKEIPSDKIISICEDYIFVGDNEKDSADMKISDEPVKEHTEEMQEAPVNIEEDTDTGEQFKGIEVHSPSPVGLTLTKDVVSADGEFELKKGEKITEEIMREAELHDSLLLLALNAE